MAPGLSRVPAPELCRRIGDKVLGIDATAATRTIDPHSGSLAEPI
jgi:hypothetical protein